VCIGPSRATSSYLAMDNVLAAARQTKADAIHPGYGLLSENAVFATRCANEGFVFIGPPPQAIESMGNKLTARMLAAEAGVPVVPGSAAQVTSAEEVRRCAADLGYPVLLKAAAGGGGRGMRVVTAPAQADAAFSMAVQEAEKAFGDGTVYLESYVVERPRHIEIQVLADTFGHVVHLGERECSIQRRHQKLIEEARSPVVGPELRERMGQAAIRIARAVGYQSAGTVEFIVDGRLNFYFLEMNTRLQVEHPVTEMITGVDLVREMLAIAAGECLAVDPQRWTGHALECRVCAEDPDTFVPSPGRIGAYHAPSGTGVRVDSGYCTGSEVPIFYDSLLAKLVTWGTDRRAAIDRMRAALAEFQIEGVRTTIPFHQWALADERFVEGEFDTGFVEHWLGRERA
jgi:acetyl/propionyl-CoA carboxylase alpha subunit